MNKRLIFFALAVFVLASLAFLIHREAQPARAQGPGVRGPFVGTPIRPRSFTGDLRHLPQIKPGQPQEFSRPLPVPGEDRVPSSSSPLSPSVQTRRAPATMPSPIQNFKGLDLASWGGGWPPDTNGDVGPNHYIQVVNTSIGIFSKTGTQLAAFTYNAFFDGTGTPCDASNRGDVVVLYDPLVDRWVITDFAWTDHTNGPFYECIAISKTSDPVSGGWWQYALLTDNNAIFVDYPKFGVWSDGYYMSANLFNSSNAFQGVRVWALDRTPLLSGGALNSISFDVSSTYSSLLPSNMRSTTPSAGTPNFFAARSFPNTIQLWKFHADFVTPANSTFIGPMNLTVTSWSTAISIPQQGTTQVLDSLSSRLMMQNQYRKIGNTESLWLTHTIDPGNGIAAPRWYEIRDPNGSPSIYQQSTFQPDSLYRWMPSLAVDKDGNMAIGYSVSNANMYPEIRYAGRLVSDSLNALGQGETTLIAGTGSQTTYPRWGDYSAMSMDPTDDCTFWYTTEYYETTGTNWQTRIGSFKFPSCGSQPPGNYFVYVPFIAKPIAPPATPTLNAISNSDGDGNYNVTWNSVSGATSYTLQESFNDAGFSAPSDVYSGAGTLYIASSKPAGTYYYRVKASNNGSDSGWSNIQSATVNPPSAWVTIVNTDFESTWPSPWVVFDIDGATNGEYYWGQRTCRPYAGTYSGWAVGGGANGSLLGCGSYYPNNALSRMNYGPFSLVGASAGELRFKGWFSTESGYDYLLVFASIDGANYYGTGWSGNSGGWTDLVLDLSNVYTLGNIMGQPNVWVRIGFSSDSSITYTEGAYIDNIVLRKCPSGATCPSGAAPVRTGEPMSEDTLKKKSPKP